MSQALVTDISAFDALDTGGNVVPPTEEPKSGPVPAEVEAKAAPEPDGLVDPDAVDGEIAEDSTEDDEDPSDNRVFIRRKDGKFAPHSKKKIVGELRGRLSKLTGRYRDAESELQRLRTAPPPAALAAQPASADPSKDQAGAGAGKPKFEDFQSHPDALDAWIEAVADWKTEQALSKREQAQLQKQREADAAKDQQTLVERVQTYAKERPDFESVVHNPDLRVSQVIRQVLNSHADGPAMAYYLGTHLDTARELALLTQHTPADSASVSLVGELLQTRMGAVNLPGAAPSAGRPPAPRPLTPVRTGGGAREDGPDGSESFERFVEVENAKDRKRSRR